MESSASVFLLVPLRGSLFKGGICARFGSLKGFLSGPFCEASMRVPFRLAFDLGLGFRV